MDATLFLKPHPQVHSLCLVFLDESMFQQLCIVWSLLYVFSQAEGRRGELEGKRERGRGKGRKRGGREEGREKRRDESGGEWREMEREGGKETERKGKKEGINVGIEHSDIDSQEPYFSQGG